MTQRMQDLASEIIRLQSELDGEIEKRRKALGWHVKERMIEFAQGITAEHRRLRMSIPTYLATAPIESVATSPVIYSLIVPLLIVDAWVSLYQAICFRAYRIPRVRRSQYIVFDRQHLAYLNWIEALNCVFCAYATAWSPMSGRSAAGRNNIGARLSMRCTSMIRTNAITSFSNMAMPMAIAPASKNSASDCGLVRTPPKMKTFRADKPT